MTPLLRLLDRAGIRLDVAIRGRHHYYSTHCRHGRHAACADTVINGAARRPAQCKTCAAPCRCTCHQGIRT